VKRDNRARAAKVSVLVALFILSGCATPKYNWQKPAADSTMLATDEQACWGEQPPWFITPGVWMGDAIRRGGFKDCMEARGWKKEEPR
jgi:hypothetical protein